MFRRALVLAICATYLWSAAPPTGVAAQESSSAPLVDVGQSVVAVAEQALGSPYRWGGMTLETGFDCTGLVLWVYSQFGVALPHGETGQLRSGRNLSSEALQPGDIVVFKNTYKSGPSHTGIYAGDGQFIHSNTPGSGVIVSDMSNGYWAPRFVAGVRIIEDA